MGGCKCSFRDCQNTSEKFQGMSFFHYPFKEKQRFDEWLKYSKKNSFKSLDFSRIRNKVICSDHFRDECFMNYQKNKLTKQAVPTLGRYRLNRVLVFDYEKDDNPVAEVLLKSSLPHLTPPKGYEYPKWSPEYEAMQDKSFCAMQIKRSEQIVSALENKGPVQKKSPAQTKRIQNPLLPDKRSVSEGFDEESEYYILEDNPEKDTSETENETRQTTCKVKIQRKSHSKGESAPKKRKISSPNTAKSIILNNIVIPSKKARNTRTHILVSEISDDSDSAELIELASIEDTKETQTEDHETEVKETQTSDYEEDSDLSQMLEEKVRELNELKLKHQREMDVLKKKVQSLEMCQVSSSSRDIKATPTTKAQLYNSIKKYMCPAMATLVKMEMFGGDEREWKPDEKIACSDLLKLGNGVFEFFRDEWRIRLPPKKDVEQWSNTDEVFDEDL